MTNPKPLVPVNLEGLEALASELLAPTATSVSGSIKPSSRSNAESYILLPSGKYGKHDYPDVEIAMTRLGYTPEVEKAAKRKGLTLANNSQGYIGNINHQQAVMLPRELGGTALSVILFKEFLKLLQAGINGRSIYNGKGDKIAKTQLGTFYNEITQVRNPLRIEWFDSKFEEQGGKIYITYPIFKSNKWDYVKEPLEECLMEDKTAGIDINHWLNNATSQGLPPKNCATGSLYYWAPRKGMVAWFWADSGRAVLGCDWDPSFSRESLGVRTARAKI